MNISYGRQWLDEEEISAIVETLKSDWLTQGPQIEDFERAVAEECQAKYAIAVSSGTAALHLAALAIGLRPGDEGLTSPNTFLASANCLLFCGALPRFADIKADTFCLDPAEMEARLTPRTKCLIPVHFAGQPCDMESIWEIAQQRKIMVIEDACHALGSKWQDRGGRLHTVGSCSHSHITVFSFHPVKTITTAEGGMILTNDRKLAQKCRLLRNHGMTKDPLEFTNQELLPFYGDPLTGALPPWYYEMQALGFNYRLSDLHAALGLAQLRKLPSFREKRRALWAYYNEGLVGMEGFSTPTEREGAYSCWHLYVAQARSRDKLLEFLHRRSIGAHVLYIPIHLQPYYQRRFGFRKGDFPKAEAYFRQCLVLPLHPELSLDTADLIIEAVRRFY